MHHAAAEDFEPVLAFAEADLALSRRHWISTSSEGLGEWKKDGGTASSRR